MIVFVFFLLPGPSAGCDRRTWFIGGIQVNERSNTEWVKRLDALGMNTVAVTVYSHQGDWDGDNIWFDPNDFSALKNEIRAAKSSGLRIVLILRTALDHAFPKNMFLWHGMIMPKSNSLVKSWFDKYGEFVREGARFAEMEKIDVFGIESEMNSMTSTLPVSDIPNLQAYFLDKKKQEKRKQRILSRAPPIDSRYLWVRGKGNYPDPASWFDDRQAVRENWSRSTAFMSAENPVKSINRRRALLEAHWRKLIREVRSIYSGKITYAANFDQYMEVGFWDDLDIIGINAYFPLCDEASVFSEEPVSVQVLAEGWKRVFHKIKAFRVHHKIHNKPVVFTEIGYTARKHSTIHPWAGSGFSLVGDPESEQIILWGEQPPEPKERSFAMAALDRVTSGLEEGLFAGFLYWKLSTHREHKEIEPFVCHIGEDTNDPMVRVFNTFCR